MQRSVREVLVLHAPISVRLSDCYCNFLHEVSRTCQSFPMFGTDGYKTFFAVLDKIWRPQTHLPFLQNLKCPTLMSGRINVTGSKWTAEKECSESSSHGTRAKRKSLSNQGRLRTRHGGFRPTIFSLPSFSRQK